MPRTAATAPPSGNPFSSSPNGSLKLLMRSIVFDSVIIVVFLHFITRKNFFNIRFFTVFCPSLPFFVACRFFFSVRRFRFLPLVVSFFFSSLFPFFCCPAFPFFAARRFFFFSPSFPFFLLPVVSVFCRSSLPNDKRKEKRQEGRATMQK